MISSNPVSPFTLTIISSYFKLYLNIWKYGYDKEIRIKFITRKYLPPKFLCYRIKLERREGIFCFNTITIFHRIYLNDDTICKFLNRLEFWKRCRVRITEGKFDFLSMLRRSNYVWQSKTAERGNRSSSTKPRLSAVQWICTKYRYWFYPIFFFHKIKLLIFYSKSLNLTLNPSINYYLNDLF